MAHSYGEGIRTWPVFTFDTEGLERNPANRSIQGLLHIWLMEISEQ